MCNRGLREGQGMFETGVGYEKDRVTWQVDRWTSRQVNKLLVIGDRVTDEQVLGVTEG